MTSQSIKATKAQIWREDEDEMKMVEFDKVFEECSEKGQCDSIGGCEYRRIRQEWIVSKFRQPIEQFIRWRANLYDSDMPMNVWEDVKQPFPDWVINPVEPTVPEPKPMETKPATTLSFAFVHTFDYKHLYHTTRRHTEKSDPDMDAEIIKHAPLGQYPTDLHILKYFTIKKEDDYASKELGHDEVFLEYKVRKSLQLFDLPAYRKAKGNSHEAWETASSVKKVIILLGQQGLLKFDGFFNDEGEDCPEVCLFDASECVWDEPDEIEFQRKNGLKYTSCLDKWF